MLEVKTSGKVSVVGVLVGAFFVTRNHSRIEKRHQNILVCVEEEFTETKTTIPKNCSGIWP
jgi:hypothetical protein